MTREPWVQKLEQGEGEVAWDLLIAQYHRLIAHTVRHYGGGYDDVMDTFAHVCESLRANDFARLRKYTAIPVGRLRFTTWLVAVVRNLVIDWFRKRHGRKGHSKVVAALPPLQREAFQRVFVEGYSHVEAYELARTKGGHALSYAQFLQALAAAQRTVSRKRPGDLFQELAPVAGRQPPSQSSESTDAETATDAELPDASLMLAETQELLRQALATLEPKDRVAVQLYVVDGLPAADVARLLGWPSAKTAYNHVYRSLSAVRDFLIEKGFKPGDLG